MYRQPDLISTLREHLNIKIQFAPTLRVLGANTALVGLPINKISHGH